MRSRLCLSILFITTALVGTHAGQPGETLFFDGGSTAETEASDNSASSLQQQYVELAKAKAALMDEEALRKEIESTQLEITELQAFKELEKAKLLLTEIKDKFPDSDAANVAQRMLSAQLIPQPDSRFDTFGPPVRQVPPAIERSFDRDDRTKAE